MANPMKALAALLKIFPFILKGLIFIFKTVPLTIIKIIKTATKFIKKSIPLIISIILLYLMIFLGIQVFLKHVTDTPDLIPHVPLILFTLYIIYQLVMYNSKIVKQFQNYVFKLFILLFGNSFVKKYYKFPFTLSAKANSTNMFKLSSWIISRPLHVVFTLFIYYLILKLFFIKFFSTIRSFFENLFFGFMKEMGIDVEILQFIILIVGLFVFILMVRFIMAPEPQQKRKVSIKKRRSKRRKSRRKRSRKSKRSRRKSKRSRRKSKRSKRSKNSSKSE